MPKRKTKPQIIKELTTLRNIGPAMAEKLYLLGIRSPEQMKKSDPDKLYKKLQRLSSKPVDPCELYAFRGAVLDLPWPECKNLVMRKNK